MALFRPEPIKSIFAAVPFSHKKETPITLTKDMLELARKEVKRLEYEVDENFKNLEETNLESFYEEMKKRKAENE